MTHKNFRAIAAILADARSTYGPEAELAIDEIADGLVNYFTTQNPNFDSVRFNRAAHGEG